MHYFSEAGIDFYFVLEKQNTSDDNIWIQKCICRAHTSLRVTQSETEHSTASGEEAGWLI